MIGSNRFRTLRGKWNRPHRLRMLPRMKEASGAELYRTNIPARVVPSRRRSHRRGCFRRLSSSMPLTVRRRSSRIGRRAVSWAHCPSRYAGSIHTVAQRAGSICAEMTRCRADCAVLYQIATDHAASRMATESRSRSCLQLWVLIMTDDLEYQHHLKRERQERAQRRPLPIQSSPLST